MGSAGNKRSRISKETPKQTDAVQEKAAPERLVPDGPAAGKLWVSPKLRESLRPSLIREDDIAGDLFGQHSNKDRMRTHPFIRLADALLGQSDEASEESDEQAAPRPRKRA